MKAKAKMAIAVRMVTTFTVRLRISLNLGLSDLGLWILVMPGAPLRSDIDVVPLGLRSVSSSLDTTVIGLYDVVASFPSELEIVVSM